MPGDSAVTIVDVHPDLLGTYGDGGNAVVLARRLRWRGHEASVHRAYSSKAVPAGAEIYCLGGGEDGPQSTSVAALAEQGCLGRAVADGAVVLAVCAGFQIVGESFATSTGGVRPGLGLIGARSIRGTGPRAVGELVVAPPPGTSLASVGLLSGYENHGGVTELDSDVTGLGAVLTGVGNGADSRIDGAVVGRVVGTYLHGPVLARNPALADHLLEWVVGPLGALDDTEMLALRAERLAAPSRPRPARPGRLRQRRR
ncbi:MAG: type 1 glutamine amidotransferase [Acidimicrobiales bacterium]